MQRSDDWRYPRQIPLPLIFEEDLPTILRWRCPNCGQQVFTPPDESPPELCDYCADYTTWERYTPPGSRYHD